mgnify:CR=1 FL=1
MIKDITLSKKLAVSSPGLNPGINPNVAALIEELKKVEINIIAAIRAHSKEKTVDEINGEAQLAKERIPIINENGNGGVADDEDDNPF